jgi:hypothetical protein
MAGDQSYDIFSCSVYFIPSRGVVALQVVYLTYVRYHSKLTLPTVVWSFPKDILLQYSALSHRTAAFRAFARQLAFLSVISKHKNNG